MSDDFSSSFHFICRTLQNTKTASGSLVISNTFPPLLSNPRLMHITSILQMVTRYRTEQCCESLVSEKKGVLRNGSCFSFWPRTSMQRDARIYGSRIIFENENLKNQKFLYLWLCCCNTLIIWKDESTKSIAATGMTFFSWVSHLEWRNCWMND